ncbi:MAG: serine hydrolase [Bergeyella sp.]
MKIFTKILQYFVISLAGLVAAAYAFGYDYLFKALAKTYLRGETSATIDDGKLFKSNVILAARSKPWAKDALYNKKALPKTLSDELTRTNSAALIVIKNGKLLHEQYWEGYNAQSQTNSFSMAKTVTALLLGMAIDDGKIKSENQLLSDFYENYADVDFGKNVTLKDLATMEAGLDWNEEYQNPFTPNAKAYYGDNLGKAVLMKGFKEMPGKKFEYQSGATQLLGFAVRKAVNQPLASYASQKLWTPLGMEHNAEWTTDDYEMEKTFCCIQSNARDYAKLGQLMLNDGKADSIQLISKNYLDRMRTPTKESKGIYGYSVWINNDFKYPYYYFWGILGQYIIIVPEKQLVIVRTGSDENVETTEKGHPKLTELMVEQIAENF